MRIQKTIAKTELELTSALSYDGEMKRLLISKRFVGEKLCKELSSFQLKEKNEIQKEIVFLTYLLIEFLEKPTVIF